MITLIQLEYITALDTYRHFATAAEKCFVTQPTLSMQVRKLEDDLGFIVFDRSRQPVIPTEQGRYIIEQARIVLQEASRIETIASEIKQQVSGELRIGLIPTISPFLLPLFAGRFKRAHPSIDLKVEEAVTETIERMLEKDMLDIGIVVTPLHNPGIIEQILYYEEMMIYHHPGHPFSEKSIINADKIDHGDMWLLGDGHCFRNQVVNFCEIQKLEHTKLPYKFEGGSINTLMKIIDREGGYTLIPELAVLESKSNEQVKRFARIKPLREVSLIYTRKYVKTRMIELLAECIKTSIPEHMLKRERGAVVEWR
ncbi:MAG: LysR substrate-binding domain-containing protein [Bacteroidales bacterium]|jgi:LysR family hydrogen peroxide-inducible transcriptional activator|nr:LysR substrate-binding domain-containing protein [Bacteroidales bacterium]